MNLASTSSRLGEIKHSGTATNRIEHVTVRDRRTPINPADVDESSFILHTTNGGEPGAAISQAIPGFPRRAALSHCRVFADPGNPAGTWGAS